MTKRMKWLIPLSAVAVVAAVALILHLSNPDPIVYEPGTVIYQDDQVTAKVVEPAAQRQILQGYFPSYATSEYTFADHPIIATGIVRNIREVGISYYSDSLQGIRTKVVTMFDFYVNDYIKNSSQTILNQTVLTVGWPSSSFVFDEDCPELHEGAEFLLFMHVMDELDYEDVMNRKAYADTWVTGACYVAFEKTESGYISNPRFERYISDDEKSRIATDLVDIIKEKVAQYQEVG